jgi:hypothetical protein
MTSAGSAARPAIGATSVARVAQAGGTVVVRVIEAEVEVLTADTTEEGVRAAAEAEVTLEATDVRKKCGKEDALAVASADTSAVTAPKTAGTVEDMAVAADATRTDDPGVDRTRAVAVGPSPDPLEETGAVGARIPTRVPLRDAKDRSREASPAAELRLTGAANPATTEHSSVWPNHLCSHLKSFCLPLPSATVTEED